MRLLLLSVPLAALLHASGLSAQEPAITSATFDGTVAPLLTRYCLDCHGGSRPKGGLDLTRRAGALEGGDNGKAIVPGSPEKSLLWRLVEQGKMPPRKPLDAAGKALLRAWIAAGAPWGGDPIDPFRLTTAHRAGYDWWSLRPLKRPEAPAVHRADWPRNAVDRFVLARLEAARLAPAPEADRRTLIRRLSFDLLGLPPTPAEIAFFVKDERPDAYERLVDRLLASPHYGERWARHWLDIVRYAESDGFERNVPRATAWPYRDWVIAALNRDLPYDEFARLQIAGDVLRPNDAEAVSATGFLVAGVHNTVVGQSELMRRTARQDELEDMAATLGQTFLGLTVHCARCHDHKFDPVSMSDYYRLTAALAGVQHGERTVADASRPWLETARKVRPGPVKVFAVSPAAPPPTHILARGDVTKPRARVAAGGVAALVGAEFGLKPDAPESARRRALAAWITRPDNPLFARVIVNRLWQHHLGIGLVETPSDLGFSGGRPSHPELLDWLASELARQRGSLKALHRLIVTSSTYRQASAPNAKAAAIDTNNRLLWRQTPRRLEGEALRDALLAVAGRLNTTMGGPGFHDVRTYHNSGTTFYEPIDPIGPAFERRTIYRFAPRGERSTLLEAFDCPDPSASAPRRQVTTTPLQALALLNSSFALRMADHFAARIEAGSKGADAAARVVAAYRRALGRAPSAAERRRATPFVERHGLAALCRVLVNSNEFVIID